MHRKFPVSKTLSSNNWSFYKLFLLLASNKYSAAVGGVRLYSVTSVRVTPLHTPRETLQQSISDVNGPGKSDIYSRPRRFYMSAINIKTSRR